MVFQLDTSPCFLLPVLHVEEQMGHLYFGNIEFLLGEASLRYRSSFDESAGFLRPGIRRISIVGEIDSQYVLFEQDPFGTGWRDSVRKAVRACFLSDILLAGGQ